MHQHERDCFRAWLEFAVQAEQSGKRLVGEEALLSDAAMKVGLASTALHFLERNAGAKYPVHPHDLLCERPMHLVARLRGVLEEMRTLASELRRRSLVPEFEQPPPPHRPPLSLLTAVWQHLYHDGGLSYEAIAGLVPDDVGPAGLKGRIKNRVEKVDDARWRSIGLAKKPLPSS
jgi:hypothetical protein